MKKNIVIATVAVAAAAALFISSSCAKQDIDVQAVNEAKVFTATIEQGFTKTTLKDKLVCWNEKDLININGVEYSATPNSGKPESATFTLQSGISPEPPYAAIYPASLWQKGGYCFPDVQNWQQGRFNAPMYARSSSETLTFNNICGVICLRLSSLDDSETIVKSIKLTTQGEKVYGPFEVAMNKAGNWEVNMIDGGNTVILDCGNEGVALNPEYPTEFYIYLPPNEYADGMTVSIESTNPDCNPYIKTTGVEVDVFSNSVYTFEWDDVQFLQNAAPAVAYVYREPTGSEFSAIFSVDPSDRDKVFFTKGNLTANYCNEGYSFGFAVNQYDFIGNSSGNAKLIEGTSVSDNDKIDLFCWSTDDNIWGIESSATGDFFDWGRNFDSVVYRTLTKDEWKYLFNTRVFIINNAECTGQGYSYDILSNQTIGGQTVSGIVIFPDGFSEQQDWQTQYTSWSAIANAGIVFLPRTGFWYEEYEENNNKYYASEKLAYWASSQSYEYAYCIYKNEFPLEATGQLTKISRCPVRLVANAFIPGVPESQVLENL